MKKRTVSFTAIKKITRPVKVEFKTNDGNTVSFIARKTITKPVKVRFKAKK